jgi:hypothetical protein
MNILKLMMLGLFMVSTPLMLSACEQESQLEESVEEAGDEIEEATD